MAIIKTKAYLHSYKETMLDLGEEIGLSEKALGEFMYALYEVEFDLEVDSETGSYKIVNVKDL